MCLANLACPTPTSASNHTATAMEWFLPARQGLHALRPVCALREHRSMNFSTESDLEEYFNVNSL